MNDTEFKYVVTDLFSSYASYVNSKLPGLDSFKTVQRRIMYVLSKHKEYTKSAKVVGEIIGNYHPHGDGSVYSSLVNLVQKKLADGKGNWGSNVTLTNIEPAAYRYTEVRCQQDDELIKDMYSLIEHTIFVTNELNHKEPLILPSRYPLLMRYKTQNKGDSTIGVTIVNNTYTYTIASLSEHVQWLLDKLGDKIDHLSDYDSIFKFVIEYQKLIDSNQQKDMLKYPLLSLKLCDSSEEAKIDPMLYKQSFTVKIPLVKKKHGNFMEYTFYYPTSRIKKIVENLSGIAKLVDKSKDHTDISVIINSAHLNDKIEEDLETCTIEKDAIINTISLPSPLVHDDNIPNNYLSFNASLSTQLLGCIAFYLLCNKKKISYSINKVLDSIKEKKIVLLCKDYLQKRKQWDIKPEKLAKEIATENYSAEEISKVISKYTIRSLLTAETEINKEQEEVKKLEKQLSSCSDFVYKLVQDDIKNR